MRITWSPIKNEYIKQQFDRKFCFQDAIDAILDGRILAILPNPPSDTRVGEKYFILEIGGYAYHVPFIEQGEEIILVTMFPSRQSTKFYLSK